MILPGSFLFTFILLLITLVCQGSWANSVKVAGPKWRFELFYYDFAAGVLIAALIVAFTFGSMGLDGFTVIDDLHLAGKRQDAFALAAGIIFNFGNILIVASVSLAGLSVAFPAGLGSALIVSSTMGRLLRPAGGGSAFTYAGCVALLAAVIFDGVAWKKYRAAKVAEAQAAAAALAAEQSAQGKTASPGKKKPRRRTATKALVLAIVGGSIIGLFNPLVGRAGEGENGLGPYTTGLIFAVGVFFSTFVYNLFFMNLPIQGAAIEVREYFNGKLRNHLAGIGGGMLCCVGLFASFVASRAESAAAHAAMSTALVSSAPLLATAWGVAGWKEFADADSSIKLLLGVMFLLFATGVAMLSFALVYGAH